jgi:UPF0716 family protein affecting phage T7 exclusion
MTLFGDPLIDGHALLQVVYISAVAGIAIALSLGIGVVASLRASDERRHGNSGGAVALNAVTAISIALVLAAIAVGIYYIAKK